MFIFIGYPFQRKAFSSLSPYVYVCMTHAFDYATSYFSHADCRRLRSNFLIVQIRNSKFNIRTLRRSKLNAKINLYECIESYVLFYLFPLSCDFPQLCHENAQTEINLRQVLLQLLKKNSKHRTRTLEWEYNSYKNEWMYHRLNEKNNNNNNYNVQFTKQTIGIYPWIACTNAIAFPVSHFP